MKAVIEPSKANGKVFAPPSKSMAHRMLICAGLSEGESTVHGIAPSQDVLATLDCLKALGAEYTYENETVIIRGADLNNVKSGTVLNCRECGSTLRFFIPIALLTGKETIFVGSETLMNRPLGVYEELCAEKGFIFERGGFELESGVVESRRGCILVRGRLQSGEYRIPGDISSQFISGLLFALPLTGGSSVISIIPPVESRPYIDMTIQALKEFGVEAKWRGENTLVIKAGQKYIFRETSVEGDYSNAAFLEAFNLAGGSVKVEGLNENSLQGDKIYKVLFEQIKAGTPKIDISDCPDLGPALMAAAAMKDGAVFTGTRRLKIKESDRGEAMKRELEKFGISVNAEDDRITVYKGKLRRPETELDGHNDHRIVMALSVLSSATGGVLDGAQAVNKSFPDFFEKIKTLGIDVELK